MSISFHKHEVASSRILETRLKAFGFQEKDINFSKILVEIHQYRMYEDTQDITLRRLLRKIGYPKGKHWAFYQMLISDRMGNDMNKHKPIWTYHFIRFVERLEKLFIDTVFEEQLAVKRSDLIKFELNKDQIEHAVNNMIAIVQVNSTRNNINFLLDFIKNNYTE